MKLETLMKIIMGFGGGKDTPVVVDAMTKLVEVYSDREIVVVAVVVSFVVIEP